MQSAQCLSQRFQTYHIFCQKIFAFEFFFAENFSHQNFLNDVYHIFSCLWYQKKMWYAAYHIFCSSNLRTTYQKTSKGGAHFRILHNTIFPPPFDHLFSNESNFFSIRHWWLLKKYVGHKKYPNKMKKYFFFSLCLFPTQMFFWGHPYVNLRNRRFYSQKTLKIIFSKKLRYSSPL